ncbi:hypothetical protein SAMN05421595_2914 [Austwickia chelonae]|uniref:Protein kinase domain-containing protein n=1 Tax=Austwickia chelonae NBRC 105200 TaxID=1184607 RepID=K6VQQ9_9MICO|nr:protein kinase family protein [Austwickia chelonae]GAB79054.1 hypothetical protein AUCHE_18_00550 [Austwickia chelonae NBRC 105200]SEW41921.1 hypothetical protein SAMN05421595_2914 [Austwickia chelonae]
MQDIAPGRTIGGRYTLNERRLASADGVEAWSATDTTLQAEITVTLFSSASKTSAAVLDAARRAAHVQDHRLVRILDVGSADNLSWIVEEHHESARNLIEIVEERPLNGEEARTVLGEAASCLATAARRGMHHLRLTPYSVLITQDGDVKLTGLGTVLALEGEEEPPRHRAELLDTLGLLGIAYYSLTTRWPFPKEVPGILPAPRVVGGVPAPSEIAAGVPADLDMLCRKALNGHAGPKSPGQLAQEVLPWQPSIRGDRSAPSPAPLIEAGKKPADPEQKSLEKPVPVPADTGAMTQPLRKSAVAKAAAMAKAVGAGAGMTAASVKGDSAPPPDPDQLTQPLVKRKTAQVKELLTQPLAKRKPPLGPQGAQRSSPDGSGSSSVGPVPQKSTGKGPAAGPSGPKNGKGLAAGVESTAKSSSDGGKKAEPGTSDDKKAKLGTFARAAADKAQLKRESMSARLAAERAAQNRPHKAVHLSDIPDSNVGFESPAPLIQVDPDEKPGTHSRLVLGVISAVCVVAFILAMVVVISSIGSLTGQDSKAAPGATPSASATSSSSPSSSSETPRTPVRIRDGVAVDPDGDGKENDNQIPRAFDGDAQTKWQSERYNADPNWGGTKGVGVAFRLTSPKALKKVTLTFGQVGQTGSIYVGSRPQISSSTKVGEFKDASGQTEVELTNADEAQYVIVWFTKATRDSGGYRVSLHEIVPVG